VSGPDRDVHSGNDGGVFDEPMVDLAKLVATFTAPGGRIAVPGFYDQVGAGMAGWVGG
jgi:di- and tripeptidase/Cys-Gly metallodipeptidase DUG1